VLVAASAVYQYLSVMPLRLKGAPLTLHTEMLRRRYVALDTSACPLDCTRMIAGVPPVVVVPPVSWVLPLLVAPPVYRVPPVASVPPAPVNPPVSRLPPVAKTPPVFDEPPMALVPPVVELPEMAVAPPVLTLPPVVVEPPRFIAPLDPPPAFAFPAAFDAPPVPLFPPALEAPPVATPPAFDVPPTPVLAPAFVVPAAIGSAGVFCYAQITQALKGRIASAITVTGTTLTAHGTRAGARAIVTTGSAEADTSVCTVATRSYRDANPNQQRKLAKVRN